MFGKRDTTTAGQAGGAQVPPQSARISQQRILPAELWEGEVGDLLRQIGMSPDDESNLVPTAQ